MSNPGPAIEGTVNPASTGANVSGVKVGESVSQTVGFYGATGSAQQSVAVAGSDAATTQALANSIRTALINLGIVV
jgi:hypothetical protein